jgi:hypothetical protein
MPAYDDTDLINHLRRMAPLSEAQARQIVCEVLNYFNEDIESYIRRRHRELQLQGFANKTIFTTVQQELSGRLFPVRELSARKIRRVIYG